jgi:hypothetical protein
MSMSIMPKLVCVGAMLGFVLGCAGTPTPRPVPVSGISQEGSALYPAKAIEHRDSVAGGEIPGWALLEPEAIAQLTEFRSSSVFVFTRDAADLDSLLAWSRSFPAAAEIASAITGRMARQFEQATFDGKAAAATYLEGASRIVTAAEYAGMIRRGDYWLHLQLYRDDGKPGERIYRFLLLYSVPRAQIAAAIQRALREQDRLGVAASPDEQAARDWVKELFSDGLGD